MFSIGIVTVDFPQNVERVKKLVKALKEQGFSAPDHIVYGPKASSKENRDNCVFATHRELAEKEATNNRHLFVLEDDAFFHRKDTLVQIQYHLQLMDKINPDWMALNLGAFSLFQPIKPVSGSLVFGKGQCCHAYILNGRRLAYWLKTIPAEEWKRPNVLEYWYKIPQNQVFAVHPILVSQETHLPLWLPGLNNPAFWWMYIDGWNTINLHILPVLLIVLLVFRILKQ
jgi:hypothetical protein